MENKTRQFPFLSGNALKYIAALSMLLDHIGVIFFPRVTFFRILGRLSLPIFAYMIAEGCRYTKNKLRYFLCVFGLAVARQAVYFIYEQRLYLSVLFTFSLAILMIYALQFFKKCVFDKDRPAIKPILAALLFIASVETVYLLNVYVKIDYGFWGCMLPVFASLLHPTENTPYRLKKTDRPYVHTLLLGVGLLMMLLFGKTMKVQIYSLLSLPLLLLYSGKRGRYRMKYFFYIFYPAHLAVLELISMLIK